MQNHATEKLNVIVTLSQRSLCSFPHGCESLRQKFVKCLAFVESLAELYRDVLKLFIRELFKLRLEAVDLLNGWFELGQYPVVRVTAQPRKEAHTCEYLQKKNVSPPIDPGGRTGRRRA